MTGRCHAPASDGKQLESSEEAAEIGSGPRSLSRAGKTRDEGACSVSWRVTDTTLALGTKELELRVLALDYARLRARDAKAEALLGALLEHEGQRHPVLVVRRDDGVHVVIDGYRRVRALGKLGRDAVIVLVLGTSETDALAYCHRLATGQRRSALEEGWLVRELCEGAGRTEAQAGAALGRSVSWVSRRLGLARALPESVERAVAKGVIAPHGAMRSLVPLARANKAHVEKMVAALASSRPTTRELATLWAAYRRGDGEQRQRIVEAPILFLRATKEIALPPSVAAVTRELDKATEVLGHAHTTILTARASEPAVGRAPSVKRALGRVAEACAALVAEGAQDA